MRLVNRFFMQPRLQVGVVCLFASVSYYPITFAKMALIPPILAKTSQGQASWEMRELV